MTGARLYCAKRVIKNTAIPLDLDHHLDHHLEPGDAFALFMQTPSCTDHLFYFLNTNNNRFSQVNNLICITSNIPPLLN